MDGLPLGHTNLVPNEYNYHHAMAQHAAAVSASNHSPLHAGNMGQMNMMPTGLNLSMNSGSQSLAARMPSSLGGGGGHHMGHAGSMGGGGGGTSHKLKHKKPKVNKDGVPAPKRATTAYINFTQWYRGDQKKIGRQIPKIGEFGKECAGKWNTMTSDEKQPFLEIAATDRERYKKEMAIFKPARDVNKPKRPGTAFMLFMGDLRKEMAGKEPEGGVAALAKLGGERWRSMTDEDKRQYVEKQAEEKLRYEGNMEEYRKKSAETLAPVAKQPRMEEPNQDSSSNSDLPSTSNVSQIPQLIQQHNSNSNSSSSHHSNSNAPTPTSDASSSSPPPPTLSPGPNNPEEAGPSSMAALSSLANPMSLTHAMAMGYAQHTLSNFASGMLVPNFNQAHAHNNVTSSPYVPSYNQPQLPGPYTWN